jgi:hypothetical protein
VPIQAHLPGEGKDKGGVDHAALNTCGRAKGTFPVVVSEFRDREGEPAKTAQPEYFSAL